VGVAPRSEDEDVDIAERLEEIHAELAQLNEEAVELAQTIQDNYEGLSI
jgi:type I restriction enzyme M protein